MRSKSRTIKISDHSQQHVYNTNFTISVKYYWVKRDLITKKWNLESE